MAMKRASRARPKRARRRAPHPPVERKHAVRGVLKVQELTKTGTSLRLKIYAEGEKIGELEIGRGSLFWRGGKRQKVKRLDWSRFAELMDGLAYED
jgi:hypothetical protein